jgi:hypothetical protein
MTFEILREIQHTLERSPDDHIALTLLEQRLGSTEGIMRSLVEKIARSLSRQERPAALTAVPAPPRKSRHRRIDGEHPIMRRVQGAAPLAGVTALARHAWAAHPAATVAAGTAATVALAAGATVVPHSAIPLLNGGTAASSPAPAASVVAATPIGAVWPSAFTRPRQKGATTDATVSVPGLPLLPGYLPAVAPAGTPSQASSSQPAVEGVLQAVTTQLDLGADGVTYTGQIIFTASGGPVDWHAIRGSGDISLDSTSGTLDDGETATITVTVSADAATQVGSSVVTLWPGDIRVPVTWVPPPPPAPSPSPSDTTADLPADAPTVTPTDVPSSP